MEDAYNVDPSMKDGTVKTSSTDSKDHPNTTGDNQAQDGTGVVTHDNNTSQDMSDDPMEYIEQANNNTKVANESPVQNGQGLTL